MHLGSIYLIANDFDKTIAFYEKLLEMPVTNRTNRFAQFMFEGHNISIMNGHFDWEHPNEVTHKGEFTALFNDLHSKALAPNTHKFVLNFWHEDLRAEHERIKALRVSENLSEIMYVNYTSPYYYFCLTDPDDNIIEVTGGFKPTEGEF